MAVQTGRIDTTDMLDRLVALRLAKDWSFRQLSSDMARVGVTCSAQTLHQVLMDRATKPYDRTLHKIRVYLEALKNERSAKPRSAKPRRTRAA
jgi:hypothetical protein